MNVNATSNSTNGSSTNGTSNTSSSSSNDIFGTSDATQTFLTLLTTELQNQDPTSPMDPTTMVSQIVELNMLSETMTIGSTVQTIATDLSGGTKTTSTSNG
jgi:flagellar basal-body rod modification protein FlgD